MPDIGHYRFLILGKDTFSFSAQPFHRFGKNLAKCQKLGMMPQGGAGDRRRSDPRLYLPGAGARPTNDWEIAGGLRGAPVELTQCKTCDVEVPATAEVVIEFEVDLDKTVMEGPLGEYTGYYTPASLKPVARITAITHRSKPIFQGLLTGKPVTENHILKQIPFEASFLRDAQAPVPDHQAGVGARLGRRVVLCGDRDEAALRRRGATGDPRAMSSNIRPKWVIVDPDIDVHSSAEVEWAMAFRVQPQRDVIIIDKIPAGPSDPSIDDPTSRGRAHRLRDRHRRDAAVRRSRSPRLPTCRAGRISRCRS